MKPRRKVLTAVGTATSVVLAGCIGGDDEEGDNGEAENGETNNEMEDADIEERIITTVERFYQNLDERNTEGVNNYVQEIDHENIVSEINEADVSDFENISINIQNIEVEEVNEDQGSATVNVELELTDGDNEKLLEQSLNISIDEDGELGAVRVRHENLSELKDLRPTDSRGVPRPEFELSNPTTVDGSTVFGLVDLVYYEEIDSPTGFNSVYRHFISDIDSIQGDSIEVTIEVDGEEFELIDRSSLDSTESIDQNLDGNPQFHIIGLDPDVEPDGPGESIADKFNRIFSDEQLELLKEQRFTVKSAKIINPQQSIGGDGPLADEFRAEKVSMEDGSEMYDETLMHG